MPDDNFWNRIVRGFQGRPEYLLIFAICAMFFLTGIGSAIAGVINKGDWKLFGLAILCFVLALAAALAVIRQVLSALPPATAASPIAPPTESSELASFSDEGEKIADALQAISENVLDALALEHAVLNQQMIEKCNEFRASSGEWKRGMLTVIGVSSNQLLLRMYETAKTSVFATTVPAYHETVWRSQFGDQLLAAHAKTAAPVTRIFVFDRRSDVTDQILDTMQRHQQAGIAVRAYFDEEDALFQFTPQIPKDFTIIDGGVAIGLSQRFDMDVPEAHWYFGNDDLLAKFEDVRQNLLRGSMPLSEFEKSRAQQSKSGTSPGSS